MKLWSNSTVPGGGGSAPERRLLAAVLQRAVADFIGGEEELRVDAEAWLMDEENLSESPLTFRFICEALDLNGDNLRRAIIAQAQTNPEMLVSEVAM